MKKKMFNFFVSVLFIFGMSKLSLAMKCHGGSSQDSQKQTVQASSEHKHQETDTDIQAMPDEAVNVGNKICPVLNEKIDERNKATYEYEGKIYNLCCAACIEDFKKDPDKYIKKVEEELKAQK